MSKFHQIHVEFLSRKKSSLKNVTLRQQGYHNKHDNKRHFRVAFLISTRLRHWQAQAALPTFAMMMDDVETLVFLPFTVINNRKRLKRFKFSRSGTFLIVVTISKQPKHGFKQKQKKVAIQLLHFGIKSTIRK